MLLRRIPAVKFWRCITCNNKSIDNIIHQRQFKNSSKTDGSKQSNFGVCFDIDGVLARGHVPFEEAVKAMDLLKNASNQFKHPVAFVTNALAPREFKTNQLKEWLNAEIHPDQVIMTQTALRMYKHIRKKHALLIGQGQLTQIAKDLSLENICMIEDITECYPLLDVGLHDNRNKASESNAEDKYFPPVEVIILMGEPKHWETPLQVLIDLLLTEGQPSKGKARQNKQTIPVIACNMDLQYMHRASFPRFGHGAFLLCLEALFKKVTGAELQYDAMIGKPSEVTMKFTEHRLSLTAQKLGYTQPLKTMYMIGDNKDVDITAANMYQNYINYCDDRSNSSDIPPSRLPPKNSNLRPQTVKNVKGVLVRTGVYEAEHEEGNHSNDHSHKYFPLTEEHRRPYTVVNNVYEAVQFVLKEEGL